MGPKVRNPVHRERERQRHLKAPSVIFDGEDTLWFKKILSKVLPESLSSTEKQDQADKVVSEIQNLTNTYRLSRTLASGYSTISESKDFLQQIEKAAKSLLSLLGEGKLGSKALRAQAALSKRIMETAHPRVSFLEQQRVKAARNRRSDIVSRAKSLFSPADSAFLDGLTCDLESLPIRVNHAINCLTKEAKANRIDQETRSMVEELESIFKQYNLPIKKSRDGAFCQCAEAICEKSGNPKRDPLNLLRSYLKSKTPAEK